MSIYTWGHIKLSAQNNNAIERDELRHIFDASKLTKYFFARLKTLINVLDGPPDIVQYFDMVVNNYETFTEHERIVALMIYLEENSDFARDSKSQRREKFVPSMTYFSLLASAYRQI